MHIKRLLHQNTEEMTSILRALNGEYIEPQAGGDLLRDGAGVLPTGGPNVSSPHARDKEQKLKPHVSFFKPTKESVSLQMCLLKFYSKF